MGITSPALSEVLNNAHRGRIQLPDFQRGWTWDNERIVSLLATVILEYPMGVVMTLATGPRATTRFKPRALEGTPPNLDPNAAQELLLDGQQRITSLYRVLKSGLPVETEDTRNTKVSRWYYINIDAALHAFDTGADVEDTIVWVPANKQLKRYNRVVLDLTSAQLECDQGYFPLSIALNGPEKAVWSNRYTGNDETKLRHWGRFADEVLDRIGKYEVHIIGLGADTDKEAVCRVFEKVNTGGVPLDTFELVTATYAADDFELPPRWEKIKAELVASSPLFESLEDTAFLQAVCLAATSHNRSQPACKRKDLLDLPLEQYKEWERPVVDALLWAGRLLESQGVVGRDFLPYRTQLPPLAAIRVVLGPEADAEEARDKILKWYWCGVFGEQYGGSLDSRFVQDVMQVTSWVRGGNDPDSVRGASFNASRLETMSTRNSAAYVGVFARMIQQRCTDWYFLDRPLSAETVIDHKVDIDRVFPGAWCKRNHIDTRRQDSVINKALFSERVRRTIGNRAPSLYMNELERDAGVPRSSLDDAVKSQRADPDLLRGDAFDAFYDHRRKRILELIRDSGIQTISD